MMIITRLLAGLACALALIAGPTLAVEPDEMLADPALEERAREISKEIRCLVCRNESIDDSNADLARDLRLLVRERLEAGDTNGEVRTYLVDRYGEFVLLRPVFSWANGVLWFAGPILFLVGLIAIVAYMRSHRPEPGAATPAHLSADEQAELERILKG